LTGRIPVARLAASGSTDSEQAGLKARLDTTDEVQAG